MRQPLIILNAITVPTFSKGKIRKIFLYPVIFKASEIELALFWCEKLFMHYRRAVLFAYKFFAQ